MNIEITYNPRNLITIIKGEKSLLDLIQNTLTTELEQQGPESGEPHRVQLRVHTNELHVTAGVFCWLHQDAKVLTMSAEQLMWYPGFGMAARHRQRAHRLGEAGLLRDYQADAVAAAGAAWGGRGIIKAPTGSGKTYIAAGIISIIGGRWLYVVQNKELAAQSERSFLRTIPMLAAELYHRDKVELGLPGVQCCSYGEIGKAYVGKDFVGVIVDECHGVSARTRSDALVRVSAQWHIGMSATPLDRQDQKNGIVIGLLGPVIYEISSKALEDKGSLAPSKCTILPFRHD